MLGTDFNISKLCCNSSINKIKDLLYVGVVADLKRGEKIWEAQYLNRIAKV